MGNVWTFNLPVNGAGLVGLQGTIALDDDTAAVFSEELVEIGYSPNCTVGQFQYAAQKGLSRRVLNATYLSAYIIKSNTNNHLEIAIDYNLPLPIKIGGCFFVDFGADLWEHPDTAIPNITMTNTLVMQYIDPSGGVDSSTMTINEAEGGGGEFCVGGSDGGCLSPAPAQQSYQIVNQIAQNEILWELLGTISNALFSADGRWASVSGNWNTYDTFYLDPQCSGSEPGYAGPIDDGLTIPGGTVPLMTLWSGLPPPSNFKRLKHLPRETQGHYRAAILSGTISASAPVGTLILSPSV